MMTRKDFEKAAFIVDQMARFELKDGAGISAQSVTKAIGAFECFVEMFKGENPRFDVARFRKACGLDEAIKEAKLQGWLCVHVDAA